MDEVVLDLEPSRQQPYLPEFKLFIATNHRPELNGADLAIWRRIHQIPFLNVVSDDERDNNLPAKLLAEAQGILAWIIQGAVTWYGQGLKPPTAVREATDEYRREMDVVGTFLEEKCEMTGEVKVAEITLACR